MKYLLILLLIPIVIEAQSFTRAKTTNLGVSWADSLFTTHSDSALYHLPDAAALTDSVASDTAKIYNLRRVFEWIEVTIDDTGASIDDTLQISLGQIIYNEYTAEDTLWRLAKIKDSTWTLINQPLFNDNALTKYVIYDPILPAVDLLKIERVNTEYTAGCLTKLYWLGLRKKLN